MMTGTAEACLQHSGVKGNVCNQGGSEAVQMYPKLASAPFQESCSMTEPELNLMFRPRSALQHGFSLACKKLPFHEKLAVVLK